MTHALHFGGKINGVFCGNGSLQRKPALDSHTKIAKLFDLARIVGQQRDRSNVQIVQYGDGCRILSLVGVVAEQQIRLDRIVPFILQTVGGQLVCEPDTPPLLSQVDDDSLTGFRDELHGAVKLGPAVTAQRAEYIAGEAL